MADLLTQQPDGARLGLGHFYILSTILWDHQMHQKTDHTVPLIPRTGTAELSTHQTIRRSIYIPLSLVLEINILIKNKPISSFIPTLI